MTKSIFNSQNIITEHVSNSELRTYFVGFDFGEYRHEPLISYLLDALVDFSFGYHNGIFNKTYDRRILIEAAKAIYKIPEMEAARKIYVDDDSEYSDIINDKYQKRGEFGELVLHLILRDFIKTIPLISKIYLKDSDGVNVHGFDAIHIGQCLQDTSKKSLYLGESKLYQNGKEGVKALVKDIEEHFKNDFLNREFVLIGKKSNNYTSQEEYSDKNTLSEYESFLKEKDYWFQELDNLQVGKNKMQNLFNSITIPLLCTYSSEVFQNYTDENDDKFKEEYKNEINELKVEFDLKIKQLKKKYENSGEPISTKLNIVLMLFPVPSKKELVKRLHIKLHHQQQS